MAREPHALREDLHDLLQLEASSLETNQRVIQDVRGFIQDSLIALLSDRVGELTRFFLDLFTDALGPRLEQRFGVALLRGGLGARVNHGAQLEQRRARLRLQGLPILGLEETTLPARVAAGTHWIDEGEQGVPVTVSAQAVQLEVIA